MRFFGKKKEEDEEELDDELEIDPVRKINPTSRKASRGREKVEVKPWGKKERFIVLGVLLVTVLGSGFLALSARNYKLPNLPRFKLPKFSINNPFQEVVITVGDKNQKSEKPITKKFVEMTESLTGLYALYVINLTKGETYGVNENDVMQAASLIKLPVMMYAEGKVNDEKILAMGKRSDNAVFNEMVNKFGKTTLQNYIDTLGMPNTSLADNGTTPRDMGNLFKKLYEDDNEEIFEALTDTIFEEWLKKGVPNGVKVSHKYGREIHVINDAGVVFYDKPYIVVVMTQGVVDSEANEVIPKISKMVYDEMIK